jgi:hypothetical protein
MRSSRVASKRASAKGRRIVTASGGVSPVGVSCSYASADVPRVKFPAGTNTSSGQSGQSRMRPATNDSAIFGASDGGAARVGRPDGVGEFVGFGDFAGVRSRAIRKPAKSARSSASPSPWKAGRLRSGPVIHPPPRCMRRLHPPSQTQARASRGRPTYVSVEQSSAHSQTLPIMSCSPNALGRSRPTSATSANPSLQRTADQASG